MGGEWIYEQGNINEHRGGVPSASGWPDTLRRFRRRNVWFSTKPADADHFEWCLDCCVRASASLGVAYYSEYSPTANQPTMPLVFYNLTINQWNLMPRFGSRNTERNSRPDISICRGLPLSSLRNITCRPTGPLLLLISLIVLHFCADALSVADDLKSQQTTFLAIFLASFF